MEPQVSNEIKIIVKWSGKEFPIEDLTDQDTVAVLKHEICKKTQVKPPRQKLLNLKYKGKWGEKFVNLITICRVGKISISRVLTGNLCMRSSVFEISWKFSFPVWKK